MGVTCRPQSPVSDLINRIMGLCFANHSVLRCCCCSCSWWRWWVSFPDLQGISLTITLQDFLFWFALLSFRFLTFIIFYLYIYIYRWQILSCTCTCSLFILSLIRWDSSTSQKICCWKGLKIRTPFMASHFRISNWKQVGHVMHSKEKLPLVFVGWIRRKWINNGTTHTSLDFHLKLNLQVVFDISIIILFWCHHLEEF